MAGIQDFWEFCDDFIGGGTFVGSAGLDPWVIADTSSAGTPTYTRLDHGETAGDFAPGVAQLLFDSQAEAQNVCLSFGNKLSFDINKVRGFECRVRQGQATKDSETTIAFGLTGDRHDTIDTIAVAAIFRLAAATASNVVVVETDDTVTNNDDVATGQSLSNSWRTFKIDFSKGLTDVRFFMDDSNGGMVRVAASTTFDMSGYSAALQPFFQIQKASDANTDSLEIDYVKIWGVR
jgi:hypothetical protein